ncbi:Uncharacterised protein [Serratia fonticola]|uniref:SpaO N-terminal domain-containing protein n=1 Tax=Serratia fonticola TaxID=47917 RepID=A0A4U9V2Y4_SERFO|nr:Uncharacterised protein [Serratia fonticola]
MYILFRCQNPTCWPFRADSGWEGMIDLYAWFASMMPEHAGLASSAFSWTQLESLFFSCEFPLEMGIAEFVYQKLTNLGAGC